MGYEYKTLHDITHWDKTVTDAAKEGWRIVNGGYTWCILERYVPDEDDVYCAVSVMYPHGMANCPQHSHITECLSAVLNEKYKEGYKVVGTTTSIVVLSKRSGQVMGQELPKRRMFDLD